MDRDIENMPLEEAGAEDFNLDGYQYVKRIFFAHFFEPALTIADERVTVNNSCIRKLPDADYVQFLVNPDEKKLVIKPCVEEEMDSFMWVNIGKDGKRKAKSIKCSIFYEKIIKLMGWEINCKYRILGKLIRYNDERIFLFDLKEAEKVKKRNAHKEAETGSGGNTETINETDYGLFAKEHEKAEPVGYFEEQSVFTFNKDEEGKVEVNESEEDKD